MVCQAPAGGTKTTLQIALGYGAGLFPAALDATPGVVSEGCETVVRGCS